MRIADEGERSQGTLIGVALSRALRNAVLPHLGVQRGTPEAEQRSRGADGLALIRRIATTARRCLRPSGALAVETAGGDQTEAAAALLRAAGWDRVAVRADLVGIDRFVAGRA